MPRRPSPKTSQIPDQDIIHPIKGIVRERQDKKGRLFLVEWEPDTDGTIHENWWVREHDVGKAAIDEWEEERAKRRPKALQATKCREEREAKERLKRERAEAKRQATEIQKAHDRRDRAQKRGLIRSKPPVNSLPEIETSAVADPEVVDSEESNSDQDRQPQAVKDCSNRPQSLIEVQVDDPLEFDREDYTHFSQKERPRRCDSGIAESSSPTPEASFDRETHSFIEVFESANPSSSYRPSITQLSAPRESSAPQYSSATVSQSLPGTAEPIESVESAHSASLQAADPSPLTSLRIISVTYPHSSPSDEHQTVSSDPPEATQLLPSPVANESCEETFLSNTPHITQPDFLGTPSAGELSRIHDSVVRAERRPLLVSQTPSPSRLLSSSLPSSGFAVLWRHPNDEATEDPNLTQPQEDLPIESIELGREESTDMSLSSEFQPPPSQPPPYMSPNPPSQNSTPSAVVEEYRPGFESYLNNQPPRPTSSPRTSHAQELQALRAQKAAQFAARRAANRENPSAVALNNFLAASGSRSPSAIPEPTSPPPPMGDSRMEPEPANVPLPVRVPQIDSYAPLTPSKLAFHREVSRSRTPAEPVTVTELKIRPMGPNAYSVPFSLAGNARDDYNAAVRNNRDLLHRLTALDEISDQDKAAGWEFIALLNSITTHFDLYNESVESQEEIGHNILNWAANGSKKFEFLRLLMDRMRHKRLRIVLVAREGKSIDFLERFVISLSVSYERPDVQRVSAPNRTNGNLWIGLITSAEQSQQPFRTLDQAIDAIISLDCPVDSELESISSLRRFRLPEFARAPPPLICLTVYASSEHILHCLPDFIPASQRLTAVISSISYTTSKVGELISGECQARAAAEEVAIFLMKGGGVLDWVLPEVRPIEVGKMEFYLDSQSILPPSRPLDAATSNGACAAGRKRQLIESDLISDGAKRQKPNVREVTHISESTISSQAIQRLERLLEESKQKTDDLENENRSLAHELALVREQRVSLQQQLLGCQEQLEKMQTGYEEVVSDIDRQQNQFSKLRTKVRDMRAEKERLEKVLSNKDERFEKLNTQIEAIKESRSSVEAELVTTRQMLASSTVSDLAQFEAQRAEIERLKEETAKLARNLATTQQTMEYTRATYQQVSAAAMTATSEAAASAKKAETLQARIDSDTEKLRQVNADTEVSMLKQALEKIQLENDDLKDQLKRREKDRGRGVVTRGGSVQPKSPRLGSVAMSPSVSRAGSRAPGSRGPSPERRSMLSVFGPGASGRRTRGGD